MTIYKIQGNQYVLKILEHMELLRSSFNLRPGGRQKNISDTGMEVSVSFGNGGWLFGNEKGDDHLF